MILLPLTEVRKLYYEDGLSSVELANRFGVTVWQVIRFMKRNGLTRRTPQESNNLRFERQKPSFKLKQTLTNHDERLKIASSMLYWAEGVKSGDGHVVDFPNSDPKMILLYLKFLRKVCRINESKLRVLLYCYANQSSNELINYWSHIMQIPSVQFQKPYVRKDYNPNGRKMLYGLVHIRYNDTKLFRQVVEWIELYKNI
ncbi:MAG: hypothetical protein Q8P25_04710 [Candidatus Curtissbacteria bacterium]|nr:hypothetical protein [Candidatus Curtissbacteria bacterium]